jgi:hypothetical protein
MTSDTPKRRTPRRGQQLTGTATVGGSVNGGSVLMQPPVANQHTWAFTLLCPGNHPITAAILIEWVQVDPSPLYGANVSIIGSLADMRAEAGRGRVARFEHLAGVLSRQETATLVAVKRSGAATSSRTRPRSWPPPSRPPRGPAWAWPRQVTLAG